MAASPADAKPKMDFDQGVDAHAALDDAKASQAPAPAPVSQPLSSGAGCRVDLHGWKLTLKEGFDFARVVYRVDDQCRLIKSAEEYLKKAPASKAPVAGRSAVGPISNYVCGTAGYQITLEGNMTFDATGTCSGQYGYSGTVVPLGSVTATLTRN